MVKNNELDNIVSNSFFYNDYNEGKQVLEPIISNLRDCDEFFFSVAFISSSGLAKLKMILHILEMKGIKGKIITTNYLLFSDPKALRDLMKLSNVEVKMYYLDSSDQIGFHTKGYIFRKKEMYRMIIGSSNLTQNALTCNKEWNTEIEGTIDAVPVANVINEFKKMWDNSIDIAKIIDKYEREYKESKINVVQTENGKLIYRKLEPNSMQKVFITRLNDLIDHGEKKALLISATGTGKTFASAFGVKSIDKFNIKKLLFVTHREVILNQAKNTFDIVFNNEINSCVYTGSSNLDKNANFVFASFNMLIKKQHREKFAPDEFDFIIIDEVHRVGENHYQDIINYFKPKFLLGMSATPDRLDGYDIYKLFDNNIAYEVRLLNAMEGNMLCPFNYYGISDVSVDGKLLDDDASFNLLTSEERVKNVIDQIKYYGSSGTRDRGLIFVNSIQVGKELSRLFNEKGYKTVFLDGTTNNNDREKFIKNLEKEEKIGDYLDYIFTVNIFNEGVDIPSINQIIMLRPTESSIIFIQQLGRGLRICKNKEFVNILDFIGNYRNNYCIAKAFVPGKITAGKLVKTMRDPLPGASSISMEPIVESRIYDSIDKAKLNSKKVIELEYLDVKHRLGKIPTLKEFEIYASLSARVFLDKQVFCSYYHFLSTKDEDYKTRFSSIQSNMIAYLSKYLFDGKRKIDVATLECLIAEGNIDKIHFISGEQRKSVISLLDTSFATRAEKFLSNPFSFINGSKISPLFSEQLKNCDFKNFLKECIEYSKYSNETYYNGSDDFVLFEKYSRRDACRLIDNTRNEEGTIFGYKHFKDLKCVPIFVSYHKKLEEDSSINYEDKFFDENTFIWFSRNRRVSTKGEIKDMLDEYSKDSLRILLFVQKANSSYIKEGEDFYYIGECKIIDYVDTKMEQDLSVVKFNFKLQRPCRSDVYNYLISSLD